MGSRPSTSRASVSLGAEAATTTPPSRRATLWCSKARCRRLTANVPSKERKKPISQVVEGSEQSTSPELKNAYFLSLQVEDLRCFGGAQTLALRRADGRPARWVLILGENGTGKTTLLQLLALGSATVDQYTDKDGKAHQLALPRLTDDWGPWGHLGNFFRVDHDRARVAYDIAWADTLDTSDVQPEQAVVAGTHGGWQTSAYRTAAASAVYGYGANRRRAPRGLTAETSADTTLTLFDDDATLRNPEEWLLQNELVANSDSPLRLVAHRQRERVKVILTRVLPGIDDVRVTTRAEGPGNVVRAVAEVHGPDGWLPFSALGLGYRTMTAWVVDLASRLFERYGHLDDPLAGAAVCLIDEIDLHLHPRWQRTLVDHLTHLFPQTQFVATAHSPLVVQAARDANLVVLRRDGDRVVIDNAPRSVRRWRLDQILTSELFDLPSARPPELDELIAERDALLAKSDLTQEDQSRLGAVRERLGELPFGEKPEDIDAMDVIRRAAEALRRGEGR